jgi:hypothetical protein
VSELYIQVDYFRLARYPTLANFRHTSPLGEQRLMQRRLICAARRSALSAAPTIRAPPG